MLGKQCWPVLPGLKAQFGKIKFRISVRNRVGQNGAGGVKYLVTGGIFVQGRVGQNKYGGAKQVTRNF